MLDESHSEDEEDEDEEEKEPAKKSATSTKKASSTTGITLQTNKSNSKKKKTPAVTPKSVTVQPKQANISPVSDEFNTNKADRRTESVSSMTSSAARKSEEKHKRKAAALMASNQEKEDQINELATSQKELRKKIAALEAENEEVKETTFVVPKPSTHRSRKKHRGNNKSKSKRGLTIDYFVKKDVKQQFRLIKFVKDEEDLRKFVGNPVMDRLELDYLHHVKGESPKERQKVDAARDAFFNEWVGAKASFLNEERNYRQGRVKEACFEWMRERTRTTLFSVEDLEIVMKRDFSAWEPKTDEAGKKTTEGDPKKLAYYHELFDFYIDELLPGVVGCHQFNKAVRHFETVSNARYPVGMEGTMGGKLIVTAGSEAIVLLFFKNAKTKWEKMYDWEYTQGHTNRKTHPFPTWSPKEPTKNLEWKTLYSDSASGQNPFCGWKKAGLKEFNRIHKVMIEVRKDTDLCEKEETLAVQRLYEANKGLHESKDQEKADDTDDDGEELEMVVDDDE